MSEKKIFHFDRKINWIQAPGFIRGEKQPYFHCFKPPGFRRGFNPKLIEHLLLTVLIAFLLGGCQFGQKPKQAIQVRVNVSRVVSGQTLEVLGMGNQPTLISQVQLIGVEAPDLRQRPWGIRAKKRLQELIGKEQPVTLEFDIAAQDKIGRTLAYVWKDGKLLNEQLVKEGYVLYVARSPNIKYNPRLERAQQWARLMGEQIWNPEKPMRLTPYQFRRQYR